MSSDIGETNNRSPQTARAESTQLLSHEV